MRRVTNALDAVGSVCLTVGAGMVFRPAAFIVGGVLLLVASWKLEQEGSA